MDLAHALKVALQTGKVEIGLTQSLECASAKRAKVLVVAKSCPEKKLTTERRFGTIPIYHFDGSAIELGAACGKPFPISVLAVVDAGSSAILSLET